MRTGTSRVRASPRIRAWCRLRDHVLRVIVKVQDSALSCKNMSCIFHDCGRNFLSVWCIWYADCEIHGLDCAIFVLQKNENTNNTVRVSAFRLAVPRLVPLSFLACLRSAVVLWQTGCFAVSGCCAVVVVMVVVVNDRSHAVMSLLLAMIPAMAVTVWSA